MTKTIVCEEIVSGSGRFKLPPTQHTDPDANKLYKLPSLSKEQEQALVSELQASGITIQNISVGVSAAITPTSVVRESVRGNVSFYMLKPTLTRVGGETTKIKGIAGGEAIHLNLDHGDD